MKELFKTLNPEIAAAARFVFETLMRYSHQRGRRHRTEVILVEQVRGHLPDSRLTR